MKPILYVLLLCVFLSACGSSPAELDATAAQVAKENSATQTALAPSATFTSNPKAAPTVTPSSTATQIPQTPTGLELAVAGLRHLDYIYAIREFGDTRVVPYLVPLLKSETNGTLKTCVSFFSNFLCSGPIFASHLDSQTLWSSLVNSFRFGKMGRVT